jgi:site-specific DNA-methyltransferase (adenine-specific)
MSNTLYHYDCNIVMKRRSDNSIDLIVTDPPYGINYKSNKQNCDTRQEKTIKKDRSEYFDQIIGDSDVPLDWLSEAYRILKDGSAIYIFCHWSKWSILAYGVEKAGFKIKNMIVLNKSNHGMGDLKGSYAPKHELLLFATKGRHILNFPEKRMKDVWEVPVKYSGAKRLHPNEKPLSWLEPCILNSSREGDLVLDPFAGSGSTGAACEKLGRKYILIEKDKTHYQTIYERLAL